MADADFEWFLIHTATIKRSTETIGANLKPTTSYTTLSTGVACRVKPVRADSKQAVAGMIFDSDHKGYFKPTQDLRERDQVVIASGDLAGTYDVMGVERPVDDTGVHHLTAHLKRKPVS